MKINCVICSSEAKIKKDKGDNLPGAQGKKLALMECTNCKHIWQAEIELPREN